MPLTKSLKRILHCFQIRYPKLAADLQPGLTRTKIDEHLSILPFHLPQEIYELYQWRNGTSLATVRCFIPHYWFLPLEEAVKEYQYLEDYREESEECDNLLAREGSSKNWFPIFSDSEDDYLFVFGDERQQKHSPVLHCWLGGGDWPKQEYSSLTNFMAIIAEAYETETYFFVPNLNSPNHKLYLTQNETKFAAIRLKIEGDQKLLESLRLLEQRPMTLEVLRSTHQQIYRYKDSRAVAPLIKLLNLPLAEGEDPETNASICQDAAHMLGEIGHLQAVEPLVQSLNSQLSSSRNWMIISSIVRALGQLGDPRAIAPLQKLINVSPIPNIKETFDQVAESLWPNTSSGNIASKNVQSLFNKAITVLAYIRFGVAFLFFYTGNFFFLCGYFFMLLFTPEIRVKYDVIQEARDVVKTLQSLRD